MSTRPEPKPPAAAARFEIRGQLGAGGMGVVHRVFDAQRDAEVARKVLQHTSALDIYRFKREFRALADIAHPNLVTLYETSEDVWSFTMELVEGVSFIEHVRPHVREESPPPEIEVTRTSQVGRPADDAPDPVKVRTRRQQIMDAPLDRARLDDALYQLVDGVHALHLAGKLHRDLKPPNVLVDATGRVVLLDFGLVTDIATVEPGHDPERTAGTPAYMSPEQAVNAPLTEASDWYSVGVILYEAFTGRRPFEGPSLDILVAKQTVDPAPPRRYAPGLPPHLDALCSALLRRDPGERPDGAAIYAALGRAPSPATIHVTAAAAPFVGRDPELAVLRRAFADSRSAGVAVFVHGVSGMGKSALLRAFLDELTADPRAVILEGRCYERESMPYKALDAWMDALAGTLDRLDEATLAGLLPADVAHLGRLFPVLRQVPAIAASTLPANQPPDPGELRQRAFAALRTLLDRLARSRPVVIAIDDLQWGDADSASFLADLLLEPPPPVLFLACHRSEDAEGNTVLSRLRRRAARGAVLGRVREVTVGALSDRDALALLSEVGLARDPAASQAIVRDCGGSPFFLTAFGRGGAAVAPGAGEAVALDRVLQDHVARLPDDARALLRLCAMAARPIRIDVALRAAGLAREGGALATLRVERLVRIRRSRDAALIEPYHDRIRESVAAALDEHTRRQLHHSLATALEADGADDHEALVEHWLGAGALAHAGRYAALAATAAENALAFHRAAGLYRVAVDHAELGADERRALQTRMGHCLVYAGLLEEAAGCYAAAAAGASHEEALELRRLEVEARLRSGQVEDGMAGVTQLLDSIGYRLPTSRRSAIASIVGQSLLLRLRPGLAKRPRLAPTPELERRIHILYSLASGMAFINPVLGRVLQLRLMREALASGNQRYHGLGMTTEFGYLATVGVSARPAGEALRARGLALAAELDDPLLEGWTETGSGLASYLHGEWREARDRMRRGIAIFRDRCTGVRWVQDMAEIYLIAALWLMGDTAELTRLVPTLLREAHDRGDRIAERCLRSWRGNVTWLILGQPDEAQANVDAAVPPRPPGEAFHLPHYYELLARTQIDLYRGDGPAAHARVSGVWRELEGSLMLRVQSVRIESWYLYGRSALAAAASAVERGAALHDAERAAKRLEREDAAWGRALAAALRGMIARLRGDDVAARAALETAYAGFVAEEMVIFAAAAQQRLGEVVGGVLGTAMVAAATATMVAGKVADPGAVTRMLVPGGSSTPRG